MPVIIEARDHVAWRVNTRYYCYSSAQRSGGTPVHVLQSYTGLTYTYDKNESIWVSFFIPPQPRLDIHIIIQESTFE